MKCSFTLDPGPLCVRQTVRKIGRAASAPGAPYSAYLSKICIYLYLLIVFIFINSIIYLLIVSII